MTHDPEMIVPGLERCTTATRYLCAAAHLVPGFARRLVDRVHRAPDAGLKQMRAPAGVDLPAVFAECEVADRRRAARDAIVAGTVILGLILVALKPGLFWLPLSVVLVLVFCVQLVFEIDARFLVRRRVLAGSTAAPSMRPELRPTYEKLRRDQSSAIVVHRGFSPFVGAGYDVGGWLLSVDVTKGTSELNGPLEPEPVRTSELYEVVSEALLELHLPMSTVDDEIYISGRDLRSLAPFVDDRGAMSAYPAVDDEAVMKLAVCPDRRMRHYQRLTIVAWAGDIAVSALVRFERSGPRLHMEALYLVRPPVSADYRRPLDALQREDGIWSRARVAGLAMLHAGVAVVTSIPATVGLLGKGLLRSHRQDGERRRAARDPVYDYGSPRTPIDDAMAKDYSRFFQRMDAEMLTNLVNAHVLDAILRTLEERGIDTADVRERRTAILNTGVIVRGGVINAHSLAVGPQAQAVTSGATARPAASPAVPAR